MVLVVCVCRNAHDVRKHCEHAPATICMLPLLRKDITVLWCLQPTTTTTTPQHT